MAKNGYNFENQLRKALQRHYPDSFVHRFKQSRFTPQIFDLVVIKEHPIFVECKSRKVTDRKTLRLETLFHDDQLEKQQEVLDRTELKGFLALELRRGRGYSKEAIFYPLNKCNNTKMSVSDTDIGTTIKRNSGQYIIPQNLEEK